VTENNRQQDIKLISNVVEVRTCAIAIAASTNNPHLYAVAVANDDQAILNILEDLVSKTKAAIADKEAKFATSATLDEHLLTLAQLRDDAQQLNLLADLRDTAKANVELLTSGEVCYPPAYKSTEELLENLKALKEAEETVASAQAS
jgi:hypothetical protein